jgi:glycerol-3-phosphate dehydrogenase (NAD(P)+)
MPVDSYTIVSIIGAGSWGTTIAKVIAENHGDIRVMLWAYERSVVKTVQEVHENREYLPGVRLPGNIVPTSSLKESLNGSSIVILATPSKALFDTCLKMRRYLTAGCHVGYVSKGFCKIRNEIHTISGAIARALPQAGDSIVAISGPSHAEEVSQGFHTCLAVAGRSPESRRIFSRLLSCGYLQCRESDDVAGVELGGTLKNPAAIAAGLISALPGCGDNLAGALIAESMKEILRIGKALGAREESLIDIAGLGDLIATGMSDHSRNRRFGRDIARKILDTGKSLSFYDRIIIRFNPERVLARMSEKMHYLAEGAYAIEPLIELAAEKNIALPVYRSLYEVLLNKKHPSLLIETIKNPDRFEELYAHTKIHVSEKKRGMEHIGGYYFRKTVVRNILARCASDPSFRKMVFAWKEFLIGEGRERGTRRERKFRLKELKLFRRLRDASFEGALKMLVLLYYSSISDRYTFIVYNIILRFLRTAGRLNIFGTGGLRRWFEQNIEVFGNLPEIRKTARTCTPVYIARLHAPVDFAFIGMAIQKAGLPAPRYHVDRGIALPAGTAGVIRRTGGYFVDPGRLGNPLYMETLMQYLSANVAHGIPVLYFAEGITLEGWSEADTGFLSALISTLIHTTEEIAVVPVGISLQQGDSSRDPLKSKVSLQSLFSARAGVYFSPPLLVSEFTSMENPLALLQAAVKARWDSIPQQHVQ